VLISNGLGPPHDAWPTINRQTETFRVVTWDHRGLGGSDRPSDESRITISDHTDDLFAAMDSYGIDRALVIGWSAGVNIAFEAAKRDQRRIGRSGPKSPSTSSDGGELSCSVAPRRKPARARARLLDEASGPVPLPTSSRSRVPQRRITSSFRVQVDRFRQRLQPRHRDPRFSVTGGDRDARAPVDEGLIEPVQAQHSSVTCISD
jgi:pimeloyl-ACP methyl ester carboxylesterase